MGLLQMGLLQWVYCREWVRKILYIASSHQQSVARLLLNNLEHFPPWLILLCSAHRSNHNFVTRLPGFRKIILDDQEKRKQYIQKDIKGYICNRIECDNKLKVFFSNPETRDVSAELLANKSDSCILYLE